MSDDRPKLDQEAERAIDAHLFRRTIQVGTAFGILNLAALGGCIFFVFFMLPKQAAQEARTQLTEEVRTQTDEIRKVLTESLLKTGGANADVDRLSADLARLKPQVKELARMFDETAPERTAELLQLVGRLARNPALESLLSGFDARQIKASTSWFSEENLLVANCGAAMNVLGHISMAQPPPNVGVDQPFQVVLPPEIHVATPDGAVVGFGVITVTGKGRQWPCTVMLNGNKLKLCFHQTVLTSKKPASSGSTDQIAKIQTQNLTLADFDDVSLPKLSQGTHISFNATLAVVRPSPPPSESSSTTKPIAAPG